MSTADNDPQLVAGVVEGEVLVDKYRIDRIIGIGGMGVVVAAHHLHLDTRVAIKILLPTMITNAEALARFSREARAAIQLKSEHVARMFDVGLLGNGAPYIVMELLDGMDLRMLLDEQGPVAVEEGVDFLLQACEAVAEAHALGIVHRDLKPANLFCVNRPDGRRMIKVLDFGISKFMGPLWAPLSEPLTLAAAVMGTPSYMSPEQLEAPQTVDTRSDIWSLGVILYETLTAKAPFEGSTLPQVSVRIAVRRPRPLQELKPSIPPGLAAAIDICLEKDRDRRFASVADLASALLPFGSQRARISVQRIAETTGDDAASFVDGAIGPWATDESRSPQLSEPLTGELGGSKKIGGVRGKMLRGLFFAGAGLVLVGMIIPRIIVDESAAPPPSLDGAGSRRSGAGKATVVEPLTGGLPALDGASLASAFPSPVTPPLVDSRVMRAQAIGGGGGLGQMDRGSRLGRRGRSPTGAEAFARPKSLLPEATDVSPTARDGNERAGGVTVPRCEPPFDFDAQGRKHFKPECWTRGESGSAMGARAAADGESGCDPNYDLDDRGRKHFKPECFLNPKR